MACCCGAQTLVPRVADSAADQKEALFGIRDAGSMLRAASASIHGRDALMTASQNKLPLLSVQPVNVLSFAHHVL